MSVAAAELCRPYVRPSVASASWAATSASNSVYTSKHARTHADGGGGGSVRVRSSQSDEPPLPHSVGRLGPLPPSLPSMFHPIVYRRRLQRLRRRVFTKERGVFVVGGKWDSITITRLPLKAAMLAHSLANTLSSKGERRRRQLGRLSNGETGDCGQSGYFGRKGKDCAGRVLSMPNCRTRSKTACATIKVSGRKGVRSEKVAHVINRGLANLPAILLLCIAGKHAT